MLLHNFKFLFLVIFLVEQSYCCSFSCPENTVPCFDNIYNYTDTLCKGFLGCVGPEEPCAELCPSSLPVLSEDGLSCSLCDGDECPACGDDQLWCKTEKTCKLETEKCGGECQSILYPVELNERCTPCPEGTFWCEMDKKCYDSFSEPCGGICPFVGDKSFFCPEDNTCAISQDECGKEKTEKQQSSEKPIFPVEPKGPVTEKQQLIEEPSNLVFPPNIPVLPYWPTADAPLTPANTKLLRNPPPGWSLHWLTIPVLTPVTNDLIDNNQKLDTTL